MITVEKALRIVTGEIRPLRTERIRLEEAIGRVLAEDVIADSDMPPFDRSQMDGYAVRAADTENAPVALRLVGESAAGRGWHKTLKPGEAVRIMTGAPLPAGADAVQKVELTKEDGEQVRIKDPTSSGRYIVHKGQEIKKGEVVLKNGTAVTARNIAVPAAFGYASVKVSKRPRVAILSTGSEIVDVAKMPKRDQIRNSNSPMLKALCEDAGAVATTLPTVGDSLPEMKARISEAAQNNDILVTTGGVSVGKYDLTKLALGELGAEIFFEKLRLKPGKPMVFARLRNSYVFGLPGNPVSAAVTFHLFVRMMIRGMQGALDPELQSETVVCVGKVKAPKERDAYLPAQLLIGPDLKVSVSPLDWHGSSDFIGFAEADALIFVRRGSTVETGDLVRVYRI